MSNSSRNDRASNDHRTKLVQRLLDPILRFFKLKHRSKPLILLDADAYIQGNIEKLVQVANVQGNLIVINEDSGIKALKAIKNVEQQSLWTQEQYKQHIQLFEEATQFISLIVQSERFGKKIKFDVPTDMRVWAFRDFIVETLSLPQRSAIKEFGISFEFVYIVMWNNLALKKHKTLGEAGLTDGSHLQLQIDILIADRHVHRLKASLNQMHSILYCRPPRGWYERIRYLNEKVVKRQTKLFDKYSEVILQEPWFAHLDHIL